MASTAPTAANIPPFPRCVRTYVGRTGELARVAAMLDREPLFLIYGVGGIGKSEFVYKAIEALCDQPAWRSAEPILIAVRAGLSAEHVLAKLRLTLSEGDRGKKTISDFSADLAEIAHALNAKPRVIFFDDLHHLAPERAAEMLGYLSRHVRQSRIFGASRIELPMPADAPTPVVLRLQSLDRAATATLVSELAERLGIDDPNIDEVYTRSGGSPFFVQRMVAGDRDRVESSLDHSLRELTPPLRALLTLVAALRTSFGRDELIAGHPADKAAGWIRELERRFLIDAQRDAVTMHDLVRDALARQSSPSDRRDAHLAATELYRQRYRSRPSRGGLDAIEVVYHLTRAGESLAAWEFVEASYALISAAGLDHLLLDTLSDFEPMLAVELLRARILVRHSRVNEAEAVLEAIDARYRDDIDALDFRYWMLAATVAHHSGKLARAEGLFERARARAGDDRETVSAVLQLGHVIALRGDYERARREIESTLAGLENATLEVREQGRYYWTMAVGFVLEERFEEGIEMAMRGREVLARTGANDLVLLLAMVEVLARTECSDVKTAREVFDQVLSRAGDAGQLRSHVVAVYRGVICYGEGEVRTAHDDLVASIAFLDANAEVVLAVIARYYLCRTLIALGRAEEAIEIARAAYQLTETTGLTTLALNALAVEADAYLAAGQPRRARDIATRVLTSEDARSNSRWLASTVMMQILALAGHYDQSRQILADYQASVAGAAMMHRYRLASRLVEATQDLLDGDLDRAVRAARDALDGFASAGRRLLESRAAATLALILVARGRSTDLAAAEAPLARAEALSAAGPYPFVAAAAALARAALLNRASDRKRATEHLLAATDAVDATLDTPQLALLHTGLGERADFAPGLRALTQRLGFSAGPRYQVVGRAHVGTVGDDELAALRRAHALVVEPGRAAITADDHSDTGRPIACELLARLIEAQGHSVPAETLFCDVWKMPEYHPLRHRNTLYVAVKRLRKSLRKLLGERTVIETAAGGWRIADDIDAISIRPLAEPTESAERAESADP